MSEHRIDTWIGLQRRMVGPDGSIATRISVTGPDDDVMGQWPLEREPTDPDIGEQIRIVLDAHAEDLPRGAHRVKLTAYDQHGTQVGFLPVTLHGKSSVATNAGHEEKARQAARAIEVSNWEALSLLMKNMLEATDKRNEMLETRLCSAIEGQSALLESVLNLHGSRIDDEVTVEIGRARAEAWREMASTVKPLIEAVIPFLAIKLGEKMGLPGGLSLPAPTPKPEPENPLDPPAPELTAGDTNAQPEPSPAVAGPSDVQPTDGTLLHAVEQPASPKADGPSSATGDGGRGAGRRGGKTPPAVRRRARKP